MCQSVAGFGEQRKRPSDDLIGQWDFVAYLVGRRYFFFFCSFVLLGLSIFLSCLFSFLTIFVLYKSLFNATNGHEPSRT